MICVVFGFPLTFSLIFSFNLLRAIIPPRFLRLIAPPVSSSGSVIGAGAGFGAIFATCSAISPTTASWTCGLSITAWATFWTAGLLATAVATATPFAPYFAPTSTATAPYFNPAVPTLLPTLKAVAPALPNAEYILPPFAKLFASFNILLTAFLTAGSLMASCANFLTSSSFINSLTPSFT